MICCIYLTIAPGEYTFSFGVANGSRPQGLFDEYCLLIHDSAIIKILQNADLPRFAGIINLNAQLKIMKDKLF
jgi:hypothetical protein